MTPSARKEAIRRAEDAALKAASESRWDDSYSFLEIRRGLLKMDQDHLSAADSSAASGSEVQALRDALQRVIQSTHSHVDGRDLLAELHPRRMLDIKRRVDSVETWFEGDWLSNVWDAIKGARRVLEGQPFDLPHAPAMCSSDLPCEGQQQEPQ